jgi:hypothetical protein
VQIPIQTAYEKRVLNSDSFNVARREIFELLLRNHFTGFTDSEEYIGALKFLKFGGKDRGEMEQVVLTSSGARIFMV